MLYADRFLAVYRSFSGRAVRCVDSHEFFGETARRQVARRHRVEARLRSDRQYLGIDRSLQRAWAKGAGLIDEEFARPMVAVVNTYQDFSPENVHLRQVGDAVKAGIRMAGGTPCEFNTFHVTDSETFASVGMRYVLPSRDLVAEHLSPMLPRITRGYLKHYAEQVAPAAEGAVMPR